MKAPTVSIGLPPGAGPRRPAQLDALTGLRFIAAFSILFEHATRWLGPFKDRPATLLRSLGAGLGVIGMPLFFVLSGFVIHYNYGRRFSKMRFRWAAGEFLAARFARLYPLFLAFFFVGLTVDCTLGWLPEHSSWWCQFMVRFLTMTQSWFYITIFGDRMLMNNGFGLAWSISTEFFFYLSYLALAFLFLRLRSARGTLIVAAVFSALTLCLWTEGRAHLDAIEALAGRHIHGMFTIRQAWEASFIRWLFYYSPYGRIFEFILGCLTARFYEHTVALEPGPAEKRLGRWLLAAALGLLLMFVYYQAQPRDSTVFAAYLRFLALNFGCAGPVAILMYCVVRYESALSRFLASTRLVALGELSYSIYIVHTWTLRIFLRDPVPYSAAYGVDEVLRVFLGIALTLVLSTATYRIIEMPSRRWLRTAADGALVKAFGPREANVAEAKRPGWQPGVALACLAGFFALCVAYQLSL